MSDYFYFIEPLWSQGGVEQFIGAIIFLLLIIAQILKAYFNTRSIQAEEENRLQKQIQISDLEEDLEEPLNPFPVLQTAKPSRERKRTHRKQSFATESTPETARKTRGTLSRELAPQGEGSRFETTTGTLNQSQIIAPSIESTVKPMLESITGIYETPPVSSEDQSQPLTLDIQKLIASPGGLRQAVLL
ncbi:MAG: hypothetical protein LBL62_10080, partial [Planctomycetaceae bacterium]|nr:hypothetical protein [Planctomycetaceae bacterium]